MLTIEPTGKTLGATIRGADLTKPLSDPDVGQILYAVGKYSVVCFPGQTLTPHQQAAFTAHFGELQSKAHGPHEPGLPEISINSNMVDENGKNIGAPDAGLIWHRDMTYKSPVGFANVLHAHKVPRRNGKALGNTEFLNTRQAYVDLPEDVKRKLEGTTGVNNNEFYNNNARAGGSKRPAFSPEAKKKATVLAHPIVMTHPIIGDKVLYCDPSHVESIEGLKDGNPEEMLDYLIEHQLQDKYLYAHSWTEGDLLMWDNISSLHRVVIDYTADEHRLMKRCQAYGDKIWNPAFIKQALSHVKAAA
jgi:taurine dioxygenase